MKNCPFCHERAKVYDSRDLETYHAAAHCNPVIKEAERNGISAGIVRERRCDGCNHRFFTHEFVFFTERMPAK